MTFNWECTHGSCVGIEMMNPMNPDIEWQGGLQQK